MLRCSAVEPLNWQTFGNAEVIASKLHQLADFVWLDSTQSSHPNCRYHILAWQPVVKVTAQNGKISISSQHQATADALNAKLAIDQTSNPFAVLRGIADELQWPTEQSPHVPFLGGWLGYWGYDVGRYLEDLPAQAEQDIELADMSVGWYEAAIVIDQHEQKVWLVGEQQAVKSRYAQLQDLRASKPKDEPLHHFALTSGWHSNMTEQSYQDKFNQVQAYLRSGDCYQVNLAQRHEAHYQGSPFAAYQQLRQRNAGPFSAYINAEQGQILSLSPERFIECRDGNIETKPIKGTRPRSTDTNDDAAMRDELKNAPKDRAENLMIVDLLRNDLGKVAAAGSVHVPLLFGIESFPSVHHLVSTVRAKLADHCDVYDLLEGAFPGGSITGAPKIRAMEIIDELEPHRRSIYCGSIGYISVGGQMDTSITIRTLVATPNNKIYCWAGGGLVADSQCAAEYQETHDKVSRILPTLEQLGRTD